MKISPYLSFNGDCKAAFTFYAQCLHGQIVMMMSNAEAPTEVQCPTGAGEQILHARIIVGDQILMGSDAPPDRYQPSQGVFVALGIEEPAEAERIFQALSEGGTVHMPLQETFWAQRFAMLVDRFGTAWMVNCEKPHIG
jgi:PhnB protein